MRVLGVIPARGGSKSVPGKNIRLLGDKPLIAYTIHEALKSRLLTRVIVSTDNEEIAGISEDYGLKVPFMRPSELATDKANALPVIQHALLEMEKVSESFDAVMMLQPTTPFRQVDDIDRAIDLLNNTIDADSVVSVVDVGSYQPARMKYLENGILIDPPFCEAYENQPRQELKPMYIRNGAIYLTRRETLLKGSFKGSKCMAWIMDDDRSVNIDTAADFDYAEYTLMKQMNEDPAP